MICELNFFYFINIFKEFILKILHLSLNLGIGDWGLGVGGWGVGDWGLGPTPQPPTPNPQSPIPNPHLYIWLKKN